jgi:hypothetical protein
MKMASAINTGTPATLAITIKLKWFSNYHWLQVFDILNRHPADLYTQLDD